MSHTRPFPYPGSKAMVAPFILERMPDHYRYVEPFGGAAAMLFAKPPSETEVYNDFDRDLANFFEVLKDPEQYEKVRHWLDWSLFDRGVERDKDELPDSPVDSGGYEEVATRWYKDGERPDDPVVYAGEFFYLRYTQWNGKHGDKTEFQHRGGKKAHEFSAAVDALDYFHERMQNVAVECMDYADLVDEYDSEDTVFYFDPDLSGWTTDDLFEVECIIDPREFMDKMDEIEGYWMVSLLEESVPDEWRERDDVWIDDTQYRNYHEHIAMNFNPKAITPFVEAQNPESNAADW